MTGLTVEMVNEMQDEMNKIGEDTDIKDEEVKATDESAKSEEIKTETDEAKLKDADVKKEDEVKKEEVDGKAKTDEFDVIRELKEQVRTSNEALKKITGDYQRLHKVMLEKGLITEEEDAESKAAEEARKAAFAQRQEKLIEMVAIMEMNPNYADVREVCLQSNLDDVIDAFARFYVKENGGNVGEVAAQMESEIWAAPNPYKKIYEVVKDYHPKYAVKTEEKKDEVKKDEAKKADVPKPKIPVDATPSAANLGAGGSGTGGSGWTAAKIDALEEDELKTVPRDIYDKYLKGTLA